jgi:hypothetical protein
MITIIYLIIEFGDFASVMAYIIYLRGDGNLKTLPIKINL